MNEHLGPTNLEEKENHHQTFEVDKEWGVLIDGQIKITPLSRELRNGQFPLFISAPGSVSFLRESAATRRPPADFDGTKETNRLVLALTEGEKLWVGEGNIFRNIFKIVDIINPETSHLICRYTSPNKFSLEKVCEGDFDLKPYEISVEGRRKIFLASSSQGALKSAESDYYEVDRGSVREIEFSEGFRRLYRIHQKGVIVPIRLAKYFGISAIHDSNLKK